MRFDDSLKTVLAIEVDTAFGAAAAWRQLIDLIGRGRAPAVPALVARLRAMRGLVPGAARAASARALAFATPGPELVALFAEEDHAIAAPVLRTAMIADEAWLALLPKLSPSMRGVLRHRRDLSASVSSALAQFGPTDFMLPPAYMPSVEAEVDSPGSPIVPAIELSVALPATAIANVPRDVSPFIAVGDVARDLPLVAEARRRAGEGLERSTDIADLVARIDAFTRTRSAPADTLPRSTDAIATSDRFQFETDVAGVVRWTEGIERGPVIGVSIAEGRGQAQVDGVAAGAFRRRTSFRDARLQIGGLSGASGSWRISGRPVFDPTSGRFAGYHGSARRPRGDESAVPRFAAADSLRQLVHELRTPANAIAGFAELIETELLGPAPAHYRERAAAIGAEAAGLIAAIDDLDTAARVEGGALELRQSIVALAPLIERTVADLRPLSRLRGADISVAPMADGLAIDGDDRVAERLVGRLLAALVSSAVRGERIGIVALAEADGRLLVIFDRPSALAAIAHDGLLSIDAEREADAPGVPLLGAGFAIRLAQNLARELGGVLAIEPQRLTLRLPAATADTMGLASSR